MMAKEHKASTMAIFKKRKIIPKIGKPYENIDMYVYTTKEN